jgi:CubicO group peptidase (beta-lactamase class C family)
MDVDGIGRRLRTVLADGFSGVACVAHGADVLADLASGDAHQAESIPNTLDTRFPLASGSKLFTAVAVVQLVESGRLGLDTRLRDCVPAALGRLDERITVAHLLTHTAGLTSYFEEDENDDYEALWTDVPMYRMRRPADYLPLFTHKPARFAPGARFEYNDAGFILLALVVEAVTGTPFTHHVTAAVLDRAGMADSGYFATDRLPARTARAYLCDADGTWRTNVFAVPVVGGGDGGAYASAPDLVRLWDALVNHRLLGETRTADLLRAHTDTGLPAPHGGYGLGVWVDADRCVFVEGADPGVAMISGYFPRSGLSLTLLANVEVPLWASFRAMAPLLDAGV